MIGGEGACLSMFHRRLTFVCRQSRVRYAFSRFHLCLHSTLTFLPSSLKDIAGANAAGWSSILVRTGVYHPADGPPTHKPTYEAENVEAAVHWAIEREIAQMERR